VYYLQQNGRGISCDGTFLEENKQPGGLPVEMCYLGWQESLEKLAKLVEPEIPDN
jgi:hypothetical protein